MRQVAVKKILALEKQISALRDKQSKLRDNEMRREQDEAERKWYQDNKGCIKFCKELLNKPFCFGDKVIKHHRYSPKREYDYLNIYFPLRIHYRDKSRVVINCRYIFVDDDSTRITFDADEGYALSFDGKQYTATCLNNNEYRGVIHILTEKELNEALEFYHKAVHQITSAFTTPVENGWCCTREAKGRK